MHVVLPRDVQYCFALSIVRMQQREVMTHLMLSGQPVR